MNKIGLHLLLADDDLDDCLFFQEALEELSVDAQLVTVANGVELMQYLTTSERVPDAIFLDLNMPRKNGFECLTEIKSNPMLQSIPVVVYSTSFDQAMVQLLLDGGAQQFLRKPCDFSKLKHAIGDALISLTGRRADQPEQKSFTDPV